MTYSHIDPTTLTLISGPHAAQSTYVKQVTSCGNPEVLLTDGLYDLPDGTRLVPHAYDELGPNQKHGEPVVYPNIVTVPAIDKTADEIAEEQRAATYRDSITPWQCRKWLNANNLRAAVEAAIPAMGQDAVDGWEYATEIRRDDPLVLGMVAMLGMSENDLHQMFWQASQL